MSTLTYSHDGVAAPAAEATERGQRRPFWRRVYDGIIAAQQRRAEREIAAYLASHGGVFTDDVIDAYIGLKMQEVTKFRMSTHPVEFELYYSM